MFENSIKVAIARLHDAKEKRLLADFTLIGGFAVSRWSIPRATTDIDFAIVAEDERLPELAAYLQGELRKGDVRDPLLASITYTENDENGPIPIKLLQFPLSWEREIFTDIERQAFAGVELPIIGWISLVLIKLYAGGALDLQDARNILRINSPTKREKAELQKRASSLRVSKKLEKILAEN